MEGYRFEWITPAGLRNFTDARSNVVPCTNCGATTPNPKCDCGLRVVPSLEALSKYIEEFQIIKRISNFGDLEIPVKRSHLGEREQALGMAICRVQTVGHTIPGNPIDPKGTQRAGRLELLEVHATTKHVKTLGKLHPVPVKALGQLPVKFPIIRKPRATNRNTVADRGRHFDLKLAHYEFSIDKKTLQERDLHRMEWLLNNPNGEYANIIYRRHILPALGPVPVKHIGPIAIGASEMLAAMAHRSMEGN